MLFLEELLLIVATGVGPSLGQKLHPWSYAAFLIGKRVSEQYIGGVWFYAAYTTMTKYINTGHRRHLGICQKF